MSEDKKQQIDANKKQFLNEINKQEDELMDEVAGGGRDGEVGDDNKDCVEVNVCN